MLPILLLSLLSVGSWASLLPECASSCVGEAIDASLCSSADTPCICSSREFIPSLHSCIEFNCEEDQQQDATAIADQFCAATQQHEGLKARDAAPAPQSGDQCHRKCRGQNATPFWEPYQKRCVGHCKQGQFHYEKQCYRVNPNHHKRCRHHPHNPFYDIVHNQCVKHCPAGFVAKNKECRPAHNHKHHNPKCRHSQNPYYQPDNGRCVKHCKPNYYLENKTCKVRNHPHHHPKCRHNRNPFWDPAHQECVKHCRPHQHLHNKACIKNHHTKTATSTPTPTNTQAPTNQSPTTTATPTTTSSSITRYTPTTSQTVLPVHGGPYYPRR